MNRDLPSVLRLEQITPEWMTQVLEHRGVKAVVASLRAHPIGTGQMADSYRLEIVYAATPPEGTPLSLVAKVSASDPISRASGGAGAYSNEVRFYLDLAPRLAIRTPQCWYGDLSPSGDEFVLLLEDLAPASQGDQIRGCSIAQAELALRNLAALHGSAWCDPDLDELSWLKRTTPEIARIFGSALTERTEGFVDRYAARLDAEDVETLRSAAARCDEWLVARPEHFAPVHGDYRLDNLLFATTEGGVEIAAVDWQTLAIGHPARDVSYFLGNSLPIETRRAEEKNLVRAYHGALIDLGVTDYDEAQCFDDYRFGHLQGPLVTVLGAMSVAQTDRGDEMFIAMATRACAAIRDLKTLDSF